MTANFEVITLSVPAHWLSPIVYGDTSTLDEQEQRAFDKWAKDLFEDVGHGKPLHVGAVGDEEYFARYHDAADYGVMACMCHDVELVLEAAL